METLETLQSRVVELSDTRVEAEPESEVAAGQSTPDGVEPVADPVRGTPQPLLRGDLGRDNMSLLRAGVAELSTAAKLKDFPEYFSRLAERTGLRMLLLKRWTSGLQVFLEVNIKMPADAKRKRPDGRAPIPTAKNDIFEAVGQDAAVYSGPVPLKHFPLDLTLMLGRGSRDRQIVILPLPSQNHWNTFIYLDADKATEKILVVAEVLAHFALARMCMLNKGMRYREGRVAGILKAELYRRQQSLAKRAGKPGRGLRKGRDESNPWSDVPKSDEATVPEENPADLLEFVNPPRVISEETPQDRSHEANPAAVDPFGEDETVGIDPDGSGSNPISRKLAPASADGRTSGEEETEGMDHGAAIELPNWNESGGVRLTARDILAHSGELPALPKAACHIMAVIEDPHTTATRLEKALAMDQALTAKVLRIANSPFYGAVREIRTVSEAIVRLGFVTIRNWTLVTAARSVFLAPGAGMLFQKIWRQSVMSAMAGQLAAQAAGGSEPEAVFIGGLMQNIGQLVLARSYPEFFQQILSESEEKGQPYHEVERRLMGFDHGELGALLIKEWNLSAELEEAVRWHHRFTEAGGQSQRTAAMIALGEEIAVCSGAAAEDSASRDIASRPQSPDEEDLPTLSAAAGFLGLNHAKVRELTQQAAGLHIDPHFFS